jgi:PAS domain S-box-containing protein
MNFDERETRADVLPGRGVTAADALEYRLRQQKLLADFGVVALQVQEFEALLQEATRLCAEGLRTKLCKVMEYRRDEQVLVVRAGVGWKPGTIGTRTGADLQSPSGYAFHTGEPVISTHLDGEGRFRTPDILAEHGVKRAINVAIPRGPDRYGVLEGDSSTDGRFDEADIAFLQGFANLLGVALERQDREQSLQRANAQLIEQGERLRELFQQAPGFMAVLRGPEHVFELANPAFLRVVGHRNLVGKRVREAMPEVEGQGFYELLDQVYASGMPFVGRGLSLRVQAAPDAPVEERFVDFVYQPITDAHGAVTGIFVEGSDVTEAKRAEAALRESEARLRISQEAGGIGTYEWDLVTGELWVSDVMRRLWGLPENTAISLGDAIKVVHPDDRSRVLSVSDKPLQDNVGYTEYRIVRPDTGEIRWMARRGEILRDEGGEPRRVIGAFYDITNRVTAEAALRDSRERLERALDAAEMGAWELNLTTSEAWRSPRHDRIFGYDTPLPDWTYVRFLEHVVADDRADVDRAFRDAVAAPRDWGIECRIRRRDGAVRWILIQGRSELDGEQQPLRMKGLVRDITERKLAEAALQESEARLSEERTRLKTLVDHLPVGVNFMDRDGRTLLANPASRVFLPDGTIPSRLPDAEDRWIACDEQGRRLPRDQFPAARALRGELVQGIEFLHRAADGRETWLRVSGIPVRDESGQVTGALAVMVDINGQKRAQEALARLNENLEAEIAERTAERDRIWHNSNELMGVFGFDGRRRAINPAWSQVLGVDEETLLNTPFMEITHPDDRESLAQAVQRLAQGDRVVAFEDRIRHADGSYRTISWTGVPGDGLFYAIGRDITEHRQAEDALRQAQKMEAVGQLTGGVAHDFNNLLTIIRSSTDLLRRPDLPEERRRRYVDAISDTVDRASKLTGQLLAFARRQALKPEVFDVADRIRAIADIMRTIMGSRIQIVTSIGCESCFIEADLSQFETALINMAVNARDAMDGEGTVTVRVDGLADIPAIRGHRGGSGAFRGRIAQRHRRRHTAQPDRPDLRTVLHDQGSRQGNGPGIVSGLWVREAIGR